MANRPIAASVALRYLELNPVWAGLAADPESWRWSSAAIYCRAAAAGNWLEMAAWAARWDTVNWNEYLRAGQGDSEITALRQSTHTGRPLGTEEFVRNLEERTQRRLAPRKGGRAAAPQTEGLQSELAYRP